MPAKKVTTKNVEEIRRLVASGMPITEIANKFDVSSATIAYWSNDKYRTAHLSHKKRNRTGVRKYTKKSPAITVPSAIETSQQVVSQGRPMVAFVGSVNDISNAIRGLFS